MGCAVSDKPEAGSGSVTSSTSFVGASWDWKRIHSSCCGVFMPLDKCPHNRFSLRVSTTVRHFVLLTVVTHLGACASEAHEPQSASGTDTAELTSIAPTTAPAPSSVGLTTDVDGSGGFEATVTSSDPTTTNISNSSPVATDADTGEPTGISESTTPAESATPQPPRTSVHFEPASGTFFETETVTMEIDGERPIYYTLDGSLPNETSSLYDGPLVLGETAMVRTFVPATDGTNAATYGAQTYVQLRSDAVDFTSNLPVVVLERHRDVPLEITSNDLRPSSVLVFEPGADGRAHLLGEATLGVRAGVRVRGAFSRYFPQVSYAVETWDAATDEDAPVSFVQMPVESDWVLSAPSEMDRALMRNRFAMDVSRKLGHYASRAQFVEVFLVDNEETASLGMSDYVGVYTALEKIKRDKSRVDVQSLGVTDLADVSVTGGYAFRIDREQDFSAGGYDFGWVYPDPEEMALTERAVQVDYLRGYLTEFFDCLGSPGFVHPETAKHYSEYIQVESWIDHNLMTALTKNVDGLRLSAYFYKQRNERIVAGPVWDFDRSLGTPHDARAVRPDEWAMGDGTDPLNWGFWHDLFADPEFAEAYWNRWDELRQGAFSVEQLVVMIDGYEAELTEARGRHFERWQELPPFESAEYEVELIREWLAERVAWIDAQRP
jgi:hypothetical protein